MVIKIKVDVSLKLEKEQRHNTTVQNVVKETTNISRTKQIMVICYPSNLLPHLHCHHHLFFYVAKQQSTRIELYKYLAVDILKKNIKS